MHEARGPREEMCVRAVAILGEVQAAAQGQAHGLQNAEPEP